MIQNFDIMKILISKNTYQSLLNKIKYLLRIYNTILKLKNT